MRILDKGTRLIGAVIVVVGMIGNTSWMRAQSVVGDWATSQSFGEVVSSSGAFVRSAYSGEAYHFHKDGTYATSLRAKPALECSSSYRFAPGVHTGVKQVQN